MNFGWKTRFGIVISAVWLCLVFLASDNYGRLNQVLGLGLLPLVIVWGIVWAVSGWRSQRPKTTVELEGSAREASRARRANVRISGAAVAILCIGMIAASGQFHAAGNETGESALPRLFGEWLVYGLFSYVVFRLIPKTPAGFAAVAASLVVAGGVNYKTHAMISEERQVLDSLAKATPLINKLHSGFQVDAQEIKAANIGLFEPLLLAQAAYNRDLVGINEGYTKAIEGLQLGLMLTPSSLASPSIRAQSRAKLELWLQVVADYKNQVKAVTSRARLGIQAAQLQMPEAMAGSAVIGFNEFSSRLDTYLEGVDNARLEASEGVAVVLDLMDANPGGYVLDKGPPENLLFRDEELLSIYRRHLSSISAASKHESEAQASLAKAQSERIDALADLLKR